MTGPATQLPPRVRITCPACGAVTRTRQPAGTSMPCVPCSQNHGRMTMLLVPAGPGNAPSIRPPEPPPTPAGVAQVLRQRTGPPMVVCTGCRAEVQLSNPPRPGEPAGWLTVGAGTPDGPEGRKSELLGRFCSAECLAATLPVIRQRLADLPYAVPDRLSRASTVAALMSERPRPR